MIVDGDEQTPRATTLENGLRVVCALRPRATVVAVLILYGAGSLRDPTGLSGLAHLAEHMMFRGSARFPDGAVDDITNRLGGVNNAVTTNDYAAYYFVFPKESWRVALDIEADRMTSCLLDEAAFATERNIAVEERQMVDDEPEAVLDEALQRIAFERHPYGLPVVGLLADLERAGLGDLRRFYESWYAPCNAVLAVAGDVAPELVLEAASSSMASIAEAGRRGRCFEPPEPEPTQHAPRSVRIRRDSGIPRVSVGFRCPAVLQADSPALDLVAVILGTGRSSRLYGRLVASGGDVNDVSVDRMLQSHESLLTVTAELSEHGDLEACEHAVVDEIRRLARSGPSLDELSKAKLLWRLERSLGCETSLGLAGHLAFWEFEDGWERGERYERLVLSATRDDVARVAAAYLNPDVRNSAWMLPAG
jgi:zinc protease